MRQYKKKITFLVERTGTSFTASTEDPPIFVAAGTVPEMIEGVMEKVSEHFADRFLVTRDNIRFEIDLVRFFEHYKILNFDFLANKIGMNPTLLTHYALGHKKPTQSHAEKILTGICQIGKEWSEIIKIFE